MDWLLPARKAKHAAFLADRGRKRSYVRMRDRVFRVYDRVVPHTFDVDRHRDSWGELPRMYFLHREAPAGSRTDLLAPRQIFVIWAGDNEMPTTRKAHLASLRQHNPGTPVILVTPHNLEEFLVDQAPLHPAYANLSLTHRSDYLRAYLMHHHGGGYSDVKQCTSSWDPAFTLIHAEQTWLVGYQELSSDRCGGRDALLGHEIRRRFSALAGFGAFICRPQTPLTGEWLREIERRLSYYEEEVGQHPGAIRDEVDAYPVQWIELGSDILNPLQLKYLDHVSLNPSIQPVLGDL